MTEIMTDAQATETTDAQASTEEAPQASDRVFWRRDYSRAIVLVRTARQARYGAPWDAKPMTEEQAARIDALAALLAATFAEDNPAFDAPKWLAATELPAKPELPEGAFDASDDDAQAEAGDVDELAALLDDSTDPDA